MLYPGIEVKDTGNVLGVDDAKIDRVVQPVLTQSVPMLCRHRERVFIAAEQAVQFEFYFKRFLRFEMAKIDVLDARIGAEHIHADAAANENSYHWLIARPVERGGDSNHHRIAALKRRAAVSISIEQLNLGNRTGAIAVPKARFRSRSLLRWCERFLTALAVEHKPVVSIDGVLGRALHYHFAIEQESCAIGQALD